MKFVANTFALLLAVALLTSSSTASCFGTKSVLPKIQFAKSPLSSVSRGGSAIPEEGESLELGASTPPPVVSQPPLAPPVVVANSLMGSKSSPPGLLRRTIPGFPWHQLPNWLTYIRCLAIPALMVIFNMPNRHRETSAMFAVASYTDWLDGFLARRWDITSSFGAFLDPVADKLMVSTALILLTARYGLPIAIPTAIILAREIAVSALREWMAQRGARDSVKVGFQGKLKTALTMVALTVLLLVPYGGVEEGAVNVLSKLYTPGVVMLNVCAFVTITSGSVYFKAAAPILMGKDE